MDKRLVMRLAAFGLALHAANAFAQGVAPAQVPQASPPLGPTAQAAAQLPSDVFIRNAIAIVQGLDAGRAAQIYDAASGTMKRSASKDDFIAVVSAANARTGPIAEREWGRVEHLRVTAPPADAARPVFPAGNYITVLLIARSTRGMSRLEQVSFRLDEDSQWRLSGVTTHMSEQNGR